MSTKARRHERPAVVAWSDGLASVLGALLFKVAAGAFLSLPW